MELGIHYQSLYGGNSMDARTRDREKGLVGSQPYLDTSTATERVATISLHQHVLLNTFLNGDDWRSQTPPVVAVAQTQRVILSLRQYYLDTSPLDKNNEDHQLDDHPTVTHPLVMVTSMVPARCSLCKPGFAQTGRVRSVLVPMPNL